MRPLYDNDKEDHDLFSEAYKALKEDSQPFWPPSFSRSKMVKDRYIFLYGKGPQEWVELLGIYDIEKNGLYDGATTDLIDPDLI